MRLPQNLTPVVPVTQRALYRRLRRFYLKQGLFFNKTRTEAARLQLGDYYITDSIQHGVVRDYLLDLEKHARKIGALKPFEKVIP